jgi:hypothetical protein
MLDFFTLEILLDPVKNAKAEVKDLREFAINVQVKVL